MASSGGAEPAREAKRRRPADSSAGWHSLAADPQATVVKEEHGGSLAKDLAAVKVEIMHGDAGAGQQSLASAVAAAAGADTAAATGAAAGVDPAGGGVHRSVSGLDLDPATSWIDALAKMKAEQSRAMAEAEQKRAAAEQRQSAEVAALRAKVDALEAELAAEKRRNETTRTDVTSLEADVDRLDADTIVSAPAWCGDVRETLLMLKRLWDERGNDTAAAEPFKELLADQASHGALWLARMANKEQVEDPTNALPAPWLQNLRGFHSYGGASIIVGLMVACKESERFQEPACRALWNIVQANPGDTQGGVRAAKQNLRDLADVSINTAGGAGSDTADTVLKAAMERFPQNNALVDDARDLIGMLQDFASTSE